MVRRFEELIAWQKARELVAAVYSVTRSGPVSGDLRSCGQIQGAALSVMSNVAEGFERYSRAEFRHFLSIGRSSGGEVRSLLYAGLDAGYFRKPEFEKLKAQCEEVSRLIGGLRSSLGRESPKPQDAEEE